MAVSQIARADNLAAQRSCAKAQLAAMRKMRAEEFEAESRRIKQEAALELMEAREALGSTSASIGTVTMASA